MRLTADLGLGVINIGLSRPLALSTGSDTGAGLALVGDRWSDVGQYEGRGKGG